MYFYKFNNNDRKPFETIVCDICPCGFVSFNDGSAVDWCVKDREVDSNGVDILVDIPVIPDSPPYIPTKLERLNQLKNEYDPQAFYINTQIAIAVSSTKNAITETMHRDSLTALQAEYTTKRMAILHG